VLLSDIWLFALQFYHKGWFYVFSFYSCVALDIVIRRSRASLLRRNIIGYIQSFCFLKILDIAVGF